LVFPLGSNFRSWLSGFDSLGLASLFQLHPLAVVLALGVFWFRHVFRGGFLLVLSLCLRFFGLDLLALVPFLALVPGFQSSGPGCLASAPRVCVPQVLFVAEMAALLD
jgi:hypothetical protein